MSDEQLAFGIDVPDKKPKREAMFRGKLAFLSNFYPCIIKYHGVTYPSVEHAFAAQKTLDVEHREKIAAAPTPGIAKRMGRMVIPRDDWEDVRIGIMRDLLRIKFQNLDLRRLLLATDDMFLEEVNWWGDTFWGVCEGKGLNHLGRLLMEIREELFDYEYNRKLYY